MVKNLHRASHVAGLITKKLKWLRANVLTRCAKQPNFQNIHCDNLHRAAHKAIVVKGLESEISETIIIRLGIFAIMQGARGIAFPFSPEQSIRI